MSRVLPILFNTEMVRAILDGRKTVTRRLIKLPKYIKLQDDGLYTLFAEGTCYENQHMEEIVNYLKPPCQPGDTLYVRETWAPMYADETSNEVCAYLYKADRQKNGEEYQKEYDMQYPDGKNYTWEGTWRPSIHMPKEAARIWLKVKDVRVERLQEISGGDLIKEGIDLFQSNYIRVAFNEFENLWNSTIKKSDLDRYGWNANPWVWVIEFERCEKPENFLEEAICD